MRHIILGTAGHIDHGKTELIKAITGFDTDRLKEEKKRGISIDLGFAEMRLPSGKSLGVVDVPGHERFVKNMLAGATGIDIVLLVVAADDGVMPQTEEHLFIIDLLEVPRGIVALTKADLVDEEWLEVVKEDIRTILQGTVLAGAPIIPVSSVTGSGISELITKIDELADEVIEKDVKLPFRLPIDRVFVLKGVGSVVTGTLWSGKMKTDDQARILPKGIDVRMRSVQVHGKEVKEAYAGQRVALNIAGVKPEQLYRGDVVVAPDYLAISSMVDTYFHLLHSAKQFKNKTRVRFHHGTSEVMARAVLIGQDEVFPGEDAFIQFRLESPIVPKYNDHFIIRTYSPAYTIGGGKILNSHAAKHRQKDLSILEDLEVLRRGDPLELISLMLKSVPLTERELVGHCELEGSTVKEGLQALLVAEDVSSLKTEGIEFYWLSASLNKWKELIIKTLREYHKANPLSPGMSREILRQKYMSNLSDRAAQAILNLLKEEGLIRLEGESVYHADARLELSEEQHTILGLIEKELLRQKFSPPSPEELINGGEKKTKETRLLMNILISQGAVIQVKQNLYFHKQAIKEIEEKLREFIKKNGKMTVSQFRDLINTSRKYAVPLLEYFDSKKVTRREGDFRVLR